MSKHLINGRITELIEELDISKSQFAKLLGTSSSRISNITTNRNKPDSEILSKIVSVFRNVSAEWLLTGQGEMLKAEKDERNISATMSPFSRHLSTENVTYLGENDKIGAYGNKSVKNGFILIAGGVQAGYGLEIPTSSGEDDLFTIPGIAGPGIVLEVEGSSMEPLLYAGDHVVCTEKMESWGNFKPDQLCVIIASNSKPCVKYVQLIKEGLRLISQNGAEYPPYILTFEELEEIWPVKMRITSNLEVADASPQLLTRLAHIEQFLSKNNPDFSSPPEDLSK